MRRYSSPITEENFEEASSFILKKCRSSAARARASMIVVPLGTVLYVVLSLIFTYGGIYSLRTAKEAVIFEKFEFLTKIWEIFAKPLLQEGAAWYINVPIFLAALLLIPMMISMVISLAFLCASKRRSHSLDAGSLKEKARDLYNIIDNVPYHREPDSGIMGLCLAGGYIAILLAFAVCSIVLTFEMVETELFPIIIGVGIALLILYFVFAYLFMLSLYLNTLLCSRVSLHKYKTDAYEFLCTQDPEEAKRNEEKQRAEAAKKSSHSDISVDLYKDTAYYQERKAEAMRNINQYVYGNYYSDYTMTGIHLDDKAALRQFVNGPAPESAKAAAIKQFNDHYLDNFTR